MSPKAVFAGLFLASMALGLGYKTRPSNQPALAAAPAAQAPCPPHSAELQDRLRAAKVNELVAHDQDRNVVLNRFENPELLAARDRARASLDKFWSVYERQPQGVTGLSLKVSFKTCDDSLEHIWVSAITRNGGKLRGRLANTPHDLPGLKAGTAVTFDEAQIYDWTFKRNGKIVGNETGRVILSRDPRDEARKMLALFE